jgi:protein-disulfide isomerase
MREIWFALLFVAAVAGIVPAAAQAPKPPADAASLLAVAPQDRVLGKPDAPITILEYASLSCPHCAEFAKNVLPKLKEKWIDTGKAKLVMRDFPHNEPALLAGTVARCVPPERYFPLVEMLFETQDQWAFAQDARGSLERLVRVAGISKKDFDACLANKQAENEVLQSRLSASQGLGVSSIPTFFINGKKLDGTPTEQAFEQALSGVAPKS